MRTQSFFTHRFGLGYGLCLSLLFGLSLFVLPCLFSNSFTAHAQNTQPSKTSPKTLGTSSHKISPLISFDELQRGIDTSDYDRFSSIIDVPSLVSSSVAQGLSEFKKAANEGDFGDMDMTVALLLNALDTGGDQNAATTKFIAREAEMLLAAAVRGGYLAGKPDETKAGNAGLFKKALKQLGKGHKKIVPLNILEQSGSTALVKALYTDTRNHRIPLTLKMEQEDTVWRIKEVTNIKEIITLAAPR